MSALQNRVIWIEAGHSDKWDAWVFSVALWRIGGWTEVLGKDAAGKLIIRKRREDGSWPWAFDLEIIGPFRGAWLSLEPHTVKLAFGYWRLI